MNEVGSGAEDAVGRLAAYAGILPEYLDVRNECHVTSSETQRALLAAMGISVASNTDAVAALAAQEARALRRPVPPVAVFRADDAPLAIELAVPTSLAARPRAWLRSAAAIQVARRLRWPHKAQAALWLVPRPWRDAAYRWVAKRRHRDACELPSPPDRR